MQSELCFMQSELCCMQSLCRSDHIHACNFASVLLCAVWPLLPAVHQKTCRPACPVEPLQAALEQLTVPAAAAAAQVAVRQQGTRARITWHV